MIKLSDIKFCRENLTNILEPYYDVVDDPNNETTRLLSALLSSKGFQETFTDIREEVFGGIKTDGKLYFQIVKNLEKEFKYEYEWIQGLLNELDLWEGLTRNVFILALFNMFPEINSEDFPVIYYHESIGELKEYLDIAKEEELRITAITFNHQVTKNEFKKWIDDNWKYIEKENKDSLFQSPILKDKFNNIKLIDEIYRLHKKKKTSQEITDFLISKYPDLDAKYGYEWVNNKINLYRKRIYKYSKKFKAVGILD